MNYTFKLKAITVLVIGASLTIISCRDDDKKPAPEINSVHVELSYAVDGDSLNFDTMRYMNAAQNLFSVTRLQYYISELRFMRASGTDITDPAIHYVDARLAAKNKFTVTGVPAGTYSGIALYIGLPPELNVSGGLPALTDNINMIWPDMMGGGYHFIKMEGHFDDNGTAAGYAVHLGTDTALVRVEIPGEVTIGRSGTIHLRMNINQWFREPNTYNLKDGNYTMGNIEKMLLISENGHNIFTIQQ